MKEPSTLGLQFVVGPEVDFQISVHVKHRILKGTTDHLMSELSDHFNRILMEKGLLGKLCANLIGYSPGILLLVQLGIESDFFNVSNICSASI